MIQCVAIGTFYIVLFILWMKATSVHYSEKSETSKIIYHLYSAVWLFSMILLNMFLFIVKGKF